MSPLKLRRIRPSPRQRFQQRRQTPPAAPYLEFTLGIAHDLNNLLTVLQGNLELATLTDDVPTDIQRIFGVQSLAFEHARQLTGRFVAYARNLPPHFKPVSLSGLVHAACPLLQSLLSPLIQLRFQRGDQSTTVLGDSVQLQQVLINLVMNANDAIADVGTISISVEQPSLAAPMHHAGVIIPAGRYNRLRVVDNGAGIAPAMLPAFGQPFITTKHKHSGLGIATCRAIIARHGGYLGVTSAIGHGTTVDVYLPRLDR